MMRKSRDLAASEIRMLASKIATDLKADDNRFEHFVHAVHDDGTCYFFNNAFCVTDPEDTRFVWIFTEHQGYFTFSLDEFHTGVRELQTVFHAMDEEIAPYFRRPNRGLTEAEKAEILRQVNEDEGESF
jgi:hypothetical protein